MTCVIFCRFAYEAASTLYENSKECKTVLAGEMAMNMYDELTEVWLAWIRSSKHERNDVYRG